MSILPLASRCAATLREGSRCARPGEWRDPDDLQRRWWCWQHWPKYRTVINASVNRAASDAA